MYQQLLNINTQPIEERDIEDETKESGPNNYKQDTWERALQMRHHEGYMNRPKPSPELWEPPTEAIGFDAGAALERIRCKSQDKDRIETRCMRQELPKSFPYNVPRPSLPNLGSKNINLEEIPCPGSSEVYAKRIESLEKENNELKQKYDDCVDNQRRDKVENVELKDNVNKINQQMLILKDSYEKQIHTLQVQIKQFKNSPRVVELTTKGALGKGKTDGKENRALVDINANRDKEGGDEIANEISTQFRKKDTLGIFREEFSPIISPNSTRYQRRGIYIYIYIRFFGHRKPSSII